MKKLILASMCLAVLASALSAGGGKQDGGAQKKTTLTIIVSKDTWKDVFNDVVKKIEADHNIAIDLITLPDEQMIPVLNVRLTTNDPPDLFITNVPTSVDLYNAAQYCLPLDNEPWVSRLVAPALIKYKGDGKIYGMPVNESATFFGGAYYNKAVMQKAGITNPAPKTYKEFLDILAALKKAGVTPIYRTDKDAWTTQVWTTMSWAVAVDNRKGTIYDQFNSNKMKFSDVPEFRTLLQQMRDLYAAGYTNEDFMSQTYDTSITAIGEGKAAMVLQGEWFANAVHDAYPNTELGSFAVPFLDKDMIANGAYVTGWFVPKGKNQAKALEFLNYWSQSEYQNMIYTRAPGFPPFKGVSGGSVLPAVRNIVDNYISTGKYTPEFNSYFDIGSPLLSSALWPLLQEVCVGTKTPQQALAEFDQKWAQFMKEKEVPGF
jgi:raffinose/stachyose/melibiose transport system substrate-binding protein